MFPVTATEAKAAIARRDVSAEALTSHCLAKIAETNGQTHAVRFATPERAIDAARAVDRDIAAGGSAGSLAGIPVIIKENCDTVGSPCSAGLPFRSDHRPDADAPIVSRLRQAGAVILGVSVSDPGAFGVLTREVSHPQDPHLTVGGSSGGSAAALAAGYCLAAIGTDTGGSIRIPSACCGTAGLKPTYAALPMAGVHPLIPSLDHIGPMANTVADLALLWGAVGDRRPPAAGIKTVGYDPDWVRDAHSAVADAFWSVLDRLQTQGIAAKAIALPALDPIARMHGTIFFVEGVAYHHAHFQKDIAHYPALAQAWFEAALAMPVSDYVAACVQRQSFSAQVDAILGEVDAILTPTLSVLHPRRDASTLAINGREHDVTLAMVRQTCLFNHTGHPALSMPLSGKGVTPPPSLQLVGRRQEEQRLLDFGAWIEQDVTIVPS